MIDTKGIGQDDESRNLDFSSVDGIVFINDGSKLTDKYQNEIKEDFEKLFKKHTNIYFSKTLFLIYHSKVYLALIIP
ncbi:hypothetical protein ACFTAO_48970 [Paenibacillus rhizoplanae]